MERREFISKSAAGITLAGLGPGMFTSCSKSKALITILHTNDVHSHIDPFPASHPRFPNLGGIAKRAALINKIRSENPNTLLLDAGDIFQGTPYFNFYGGELEFKLMSKLGYDAATIGNHDFDNGISGLLSQMPNAGFELISANYDFSNTILEGMISPYTLFELQGIRIGVFGLGIKLEGLVPKSLYRETIYYNPIEIAQDTSRILKEEKDCDLVICLSHLGYQYRNESQRPDDLRLAAQTENIDLIIGGHTHTFMENPVIRRNRKDKAVMINQVGCYGLYLGRIDFYFDEERNHSSEGVQIEV